MNNILEKNQEVEIGIKRYTNEEWRKLHPIVIKKINWLDRLLNLFNIK